MTAPGKSLESRILDWLQTQGYPLEMWVAGALEANGFSATLSDYYEDPTTSELREIDVTGMSHVETLDRIFPVRMCVRVECKVSKGKPWVVFMRENEGEFPEWPVAPPYVPSTRGYHDLWLAAGKSLPQLPDAYNSLVDARVLAPLKVGHSMVQVRFNSDNNLDVAYKAITSAVNASVALARAVDRWTTKKEESKPLWVVFPAIVIDGQLFECGQQEADHLELREVNRTAVLWKGLSKETSPPVVVHVCTREGLADLISCLTSARYVIGYMFENSGHVLAKTSVRKRAQVSEY